MSLAEGILDPSKKTTGDMFIGWAPAPKVDRRFLLGALPLAFAGTSGASWLIAKNLDDPGAGAWLTNTTHSVTGVLTHHPYPMIRFADTNAPFGLRTVLIVAIGKCTSALEWRDRAAEAVTASGVLIQRKDHQMLEVPPFAQEWLASVDGPVDTALAAPTIESLGSARLAGTIMDSKCFFGVMRPGRGKTHKACASLCIRGGIPPSFWVRSRDGREQIMLMTDAAGDPMPKDILPLVADPVEAEGEIVRVGDLIQFRADTSAYRRI
ncbi:MAG: hypothetical protein DHS20C05_08910 [Hyphococcus sp.]|nr:MAG: hypothetical protein DHS20C05_08910 [Marinicaulis sp.]